MLPEYTAIWMRRSLRERWFEREFALASVTNTLQPLLGGYDG